MKPLLTTVWNAQNWELSSSRVVEVQGISAPFPWDPGSSQHPGAAAAQHNAKFFPSLSPTLQKRCPAEIIRCVYSDLRPIAQCCPQK